MKPNVASGDIAGKQAVGRLPGSTQPTQAAMIPTHILLIRKSFDQVVPVRDQAVALFYKRLFEIDPSTRLLFRDDLKAQGAKLIAALSTVVESLPDPDTMLSMLQGLARRHVGYGVTEAHYDSVGDALIWTLEHALGPAFTPEVRQAWADAYELLASVMSDAARAVPSAKVA
jgi:hemoglobin-like flavoprotein